MPATSVKEELKQEEIVDDTASAETIAPASNEAVDMNKLAALRAKAQAKATEQKLAAKPKKERSIVFGVVGSGQAGSRLAEAFYKLDYEAVVMNTAIQDLKHIDIPDANKLLLEGTLGGAAKEMDLGRHAAETNRQAIQE